MLLNRKFILLSIILALINIPAFADDNAAVVTNVSEAEGAGSVPELDTPEKKADIPKQDNKPVSVTSPLLKDKQERIRIDDHKKIAVMGEFGMGNVASLYGAYDLGPIFLGVGLGYAFYDDKENETSINIIEPALLVMKQFDISKHNNLIITRIRAGIDFVSEDRFGLSGDTVCISTDVMAQLKGIYAGISLPLIIGKEGTSIAFGIGAGYMFKF